MILQMHVKGIKQGFGKKHSQRRAKEVSVMLVFHEGFGLLSRTTPRAIKNLYMGYYTRCLCFSLHRFTFSTLQRVTIMTGRCVNFPSQSAHCVAQLPSGLNWFCLFYIFVL